LIKNACGSILNYAKNHADAAISFIHRRSGAEPNASGFSRHYFG
jgi:hypothetical protein